MINSFKFPKTIADQICETVKTLNDRHDEVAHAFSSIGKINYNDDLIKSLSVPLLRKMSEGEKAQHEIEEKLANNPGVPYCVLYNGKEYPFVKTERDGDQITFIGENDSQIATQHYSQINYRPFIQEEEKEREIGFPVGKQNTTKD